jgi:NAD-dependent dihydropyrimidine dehydrogenase PreA subunit
MAKRNIITIDQDACTGCGLCIPNCPEGAIQIIDGKARLVSDLTCDGLGACLGHCPEGAISVIEREAEAYDERKVMANIVTQGANTIRAHLTAAETMAGTRPSALTHWPVQMHLVSPNAPHYKGADVLLAADCVAYSLGDFHKDYLKGKALAIACPNKLDEGQEVYVAKIKALIDEAKINTLTVMIMQVPCCGGLLQLARTAVGQAGRKIPVKAVVVSLQGEILKEEWV